MSASVIDLLGRDERQVIDAYLADEHTNPQLAPIFNRWGIPDLDDKTRLAAAVAQILLHGVQDRLPQWAMVVDGKVTAARRRHRRGEQARLRFDPVLIGEINWASTGPGYSWPEAYHLTALPGWGRWIVTASVDSTDLWGCTDQAIAHLPFELAEADAAERGVTGWWRALYQVCDQERWECVFEGGLADEALLQAWAGSVWDASEPPA